MIYVRYPSDVMEYCTHMDGIDRGNNTELQGLLLLKWLTLNWYKKVITTIADFNFLQAYAVWRLSVSDLNENSNQKEGR